MSEVNKQPARVPLVDPSTGMITRPWYTFFEQVFLRGGGTYAPSNNELVVDLHDDAGIEEIKADVYRLRDEGRAIPPPTQIPDYQDIAPPGAFFMPNEDPSACIEALEALVSRMSQDIDELKQGRA